MKPHPSSDSGTCVRGAWRSASVLIAALLALAAAPGTAQDPPAAATAPVPASAAPSAPKGAVAGASSSASSSASSGAPVRASIGASTPVPACARAADPGGSATPATPGPPMGGCPGPGALLAFVRPADPLDVATVGARYLRGLRVEGGRKPYRFRRVLGPLPQGVELDPEGLLVGTPQTAGRFEWVAEVRDEAGSTVTQAYVLTVRPPKRPATPARAAASAGAGAAASTPASDAASAPRRPPLRRLEALPARSPGEFTAHFYQLDAAVLQSIFPGPEPAPDPAFGADGPPPDPCRVADGGPFRRFLTGCWGETEQVQLLEWTKPLRDVEFPSLDAFLAAVDWRACDYARKQSRGGKDRVFPDLPEVSASDARVLCRRFDEASPTAGGADAAAPPAPKPGAAAATKATGPRASAASAPAAASGSAIAGLIPGLTPGLNPEPPKSLLTPELRAWLARHAQQRLSLDPDQPAPGEHWSAVPGCGCADVEANERVFVLSHGWPGARPVPVVKPPADPNAPPADAKPPPPLPAQLPLDFRTISRLTVFGAGVESGDRLAAGAASLPEPDRAQRENPRITQNTLLARRYGSKVDLGLQYTGDWTRFAATGADDAAVGRDLKSYAERLVAVLDAPLASVQARLAGSLPGLAEPQHFADGVTLAFDSLPAADDGSVEARRFGQGVIRFVSAVAAAMKRNPGRSYAINLVVDPRHFASDGAALSTANLFKLLLETEVPRLDADGKVQLGGGKDEPITSNVYLFLIVPLAEPTTFTKKELRSAIEASSELHGSNRTYFLRSVVPVLALPQRDHPQFEDDLIYAEDNFGGVGLWPLPVLDDHNFTRDHQTHLRRIFDADSGVTTRTDWICALVCPNRWAFRLAFELALLAGLAVFGLFQLNCELDQRLRGAKWFSGLPALLLLMLLMMCDPKFAMPPGLKFGITFVALLLTSALAIGWWLWNRNHPSPRQP